MKITNVNDYVDQVHEKFPELTKEEVKRILVYGWKMVVQYASNGNDIAVRTNKFFFFIGRIPTNSLKLFENYCFKLSKRIAYMFQRTKSKWDGYYYFSRNEQQYIDYIKQKNKKYKTFNKTAWHKKFYEEIKTDKAELIIQRDPLNMNDLMVSNNKYKYIQ